MFNNIIELCQGLFYNISSIYNIHLLFKNSWTTYLYILFINSSLLCIPCYIYSIDNLFFKFIYYLWIIPA